ncbi:structural protein, partial [Streptococcus pneumoniae]|nr:structural protein [Streptococcus pneumoniae]
GGGAHLVQYFAERDGRRRLFIRAKTNGNWTPWVEYARKEDVLLKSDSNPTPWQNAILQNGWNHHRDYGGVQFSKTFDGV